MWSATDKSANVITLVKQGDFPKYVDEQMGYLLLNGASTGESRVMFKDFLPSENVFNSHFRLSVCIFMGSAKGQINIGIGSELVFCMNSFIPQSYFMHDNAPKGKELKFSNPHENYYDVFLLLTLESKQLGDRRILTVYNGLKIENVLDITDIIFSSTSFYVGAQNEGGATGSHYLNYVKLEKAAN